MDISELYTHIFFPGHPSSLPVLIPGRGGGGGGGYLGQFLLVMCRWAVLMPLLSILWPIIDPILVTVGQIFDFRDPNLVTFYLCILYVGHPKMN